MPSLSSLTKSIFSSISDRKAPCAIMELSADDKPSGDFISMQYFPETITDSKAVNYAAREIPGGSLPLYQWISSGERAIGFTAVFSTDVDLIQDAGAYQKLVQNGQARRNVDIRTALLWLRRFMLPRYEGDGGLGVPLTRAPRKLLFMVTNSGIALNGGSYGQSTSDLYGGTVSQLGSGDTDVLPAIMTQCDITYESLFPSGLPRLVAVQIQLVQIAQLQGVVDFPRVGPALDKLVTGGKNGGTNIIGGQRASGAYFPYNLKVDFS